MSFRFYLMKIIKYLVVTTFMYIILRYVSPSAVSQRDMIFIISGILLAQIIFDITLGISSSTSDSSEGCTLNALKQGNSTVYDYKREHFNETKDSKDSKSVPNYVIDVDQDHSLTVQQELRDKMRQQAPQQNSDIINNEMKYSMYRNNDRPLGEDIDRANHDYEYGYSFLPPFLWTPYLTKPPVCVSATRCPVCPSSYSSTADLKEFDNSRRVMPPDNINVDYVREKLNSGR